MAAENQIICGDCLEIMHTLPKAKMIFADPPDNLGMKYKGFYDKWPSYTAYTSWLIDIMKTGWPQCEIFWLSHYYRYEPLVFEFAASQIIYRNWRKIIWRFTFGQHNQNDFANGYRPILRLNSADGTFYPNAVRIQSQRQRNGDKRADVRGRVPDDVWEFPRVCGTFNERRKWHPNQHPEALIERMVKFSCKPGDLVIDMFAGTGTVNRVCKRLGIDCIGIEISRFYCDKIREDLENIKKEKYVEPA